MIIERFTRTAREVVADAQREAHVLGAPAVGAEHILVAALERCSPLVEPRLVLGWPGLSGRWKELPRADDVRARLAATDPDAEALATIGISLTAVRRALENAFGPGVWEAPRGRRRLPFTAEAKRVLELALREALELRIKRLDHHLILLGLLREDGTARRLLRELDVDVDAVRERLRLEYASLTG